ncbi:MAG: hypothetical protein NTZ87_02690 [Candidatus Nomurabacteria bacterium]|nr:hypothetical protein [Candidatus Nomurabacteria bacterium]
MEGLEKRGTPAIERGVSIRERVEGFRAIIGNMINQSELMGGSTSEVTTAIFRLQDGTPENEKKLKEVLDLLEELKDRGLGEVKGIGDKGLIRRRKEVGERISTLVYGR